MAATCAIVMWVHPSAFGEPGHNARLQAPVDSGADLVKILVYRLDFERYKANIKRLTQFGDRRQGTDRNRRAIDWIEAQLQSFGCANIERLKYDYQPPNPDIRSTIANSAGGPGTPTPSGATSVGGGTPRGLRVRTGINNDPNAQPDPKLRELNAQPSAPGIREEIYCTKVGTIHPDEMYMVSAHLDGIGWGEAANDNDQDTWKLVLFIRHLPNLSPEEIRDMERFNPKSDAEREEDKEEQEFLNGGPAGDAAKKPR